jgi:surfeit locus 1 family protein
MRRLNFPLILGLGGAAILVSLGIWQVQRLGWKEALLAEINTRIADAPVALPAAPTPEADRFLPVVVEGRYLPGEILVLSGMKGVGPGFRVIAPFETDGGRHILIDRGFVPETAKSELRPAMTDRVVGNLQWPRESDSYTPAPDLTTGLWFARDVPAIAEALGTEPILVVLRETSETDPAVTPQPVTSEGIPNDHLGYAITWFGLAVVWLGMTAHMIRRITRPAD